MPKHLLTIVGCACALLTACQLNDHDSAPRAPDEGMDQSVDPATLGAAQAGANSGTGGDDPDQGDAAAPTNPPLTQGDAGLPPFGNAPVGTQVDAAIPSSTTFPGLEAGTATPMLPVLPGLEAGTIAPPNPGF